MKNENNLEKFKKYVGEITLGETLRFARERSELNQGELGKKFNKSKQFISDIENMRRTITFETVMSYAMHCDDLTEHLLSRYYEYTLKSSGLIKKYEVILKEIEPLKKST